MSMVMISGYVHIAGVMTNIIIAVIELRHISLHCIDNSSVCDALRFGIFLMNIMRELL